ncbi:hypothetical protein GCM10027031_19900 [Corynebacterium atrinae]
MPRICHGDSALAAAEEEFKSLRAAEPIEVEAEFDGEWLIQNEQLGTR